MKLKLVEPALAVCKITDSGQVDVTKPFTFLSVTDDERSLVCQAAYVPADAVVVERGWRAFRVVGTLAFSMVGVLAKISGLLAQAGMSIFVVSTFDTDYILVKEDVVVRAAQVLAEQGYVIEQ